MNPDHKYAHIGTFMHTRGVHGQLVAPLEFTFKSIDPITFIFIKIIGNTYVPYQVEEKRLLKPDQAWLKLQDINSKEAAHNMLGKTIWLLQDTLQLLPITSPVTHQLMGYDIKDMMLGRLGIVVKIEKFPKQHCLVVEYQNQELLIPYVSAFIKNVDHAQKNITICLPDRFIEALGLKNNIPCNS